jgi:hypothetical protein
MRCTHLRSGPAALRWVSLGDIVLLTDGSVDRLFENGLRVNHFKLGFEVVEMMRGRAAVGATPSVIKGEVLTHDIVGKGAPVVKLYVSQVAQDMAR